MEIRLFGEVELRVPGQALDVGAPRRQAVLAALTVDAGRPVAIEALVDRVWDESPPVEARNVLYSHLSRIRQLLVRAADLTGEPVVRIERRHAGYVLGVDPDLVDLHRFCRLVEHGCSPQSSDVDRVGVLAEALELWRGPPLAAVSGRWAAQVRSSWHRHRLDGVVRWAQAMLRLDNPTAVITVLHDFVAEYPLVEPLEGLLMRALHAGGRGAEAIDRYAMLRQRLADDLGADPGPEIHALHEAILRGEQPPALPDPAIGTGRPLATPMRFPPDPNGITGRDHEPRHLEGLTDTFVSPHVDPLADFFGRESELDAMRTTFISAASRGAPKTVVLTGMGGIGKTSLARAYARHHRADYGVVWWIRAEEPATIDGDFRTLLEILAPHDAGQIRDAVTAVHALLADQPRPWLLVLDNLPEAAAARGMVPAAGEGHVLITSQATAHWPSGQAVVAVEPLLQKASIALLTSLSLDGDRDAAQLLAQELGGLPLALAQAGAFVRTNALSLASYLRLYRSRRAELHEQGRLPDYPHTVTTTWQLAIDRLPTTARALLNILCFYAPDTIPIHVLLTPNNPAEITLPDAVEPPLRALLADELARHRAVGDLLAYGLITQVPATTMTVSVHRLIQTVTRDHLSTQHTITEWVRGACALLTAAFPTTQTHGVASATRDYVAHDQFAELLSMQQRVLGTEHPDTLTTYGGLAYWTGRAGDTAQARDLYAELLPLQHRVLGPEHPDTLITHYYLARWTGQAGDPVQACDLFAELLSVQQRVLGLEHSDTLITQYGVAYWTGTAGDTVRARDLCAELLPLQQQVLGPEHPDTLITQHNVTYWAQRTPCSVAGRDLFAHLLPIQEQMLGTTHPDTLAIRHNIPYWAEQELDIIASRDLFVFLFPAYKQRLGAEHPDALGYHHNLARWTGYAGDPAGARDLYTELLAVQERVLGAEHPDTLTVRHNLAYWTGLAGDAARGRDLCGELLAVRERVLGAEHPDTLTTRHNLAYWTGQAGNAAKARDLFIELVPVWERVLGAEHPDILTARHHLARWIGKAGDATGARDLFAKLLPVREQVLGAEHPDTLTTRNQLAHWTAATASDR